MVVSSLLTGPCRSSHRTDTVERDSRYLLGGNHGMDRNLALEAVRVTEAAALAAARFVGLGDRDGADQAATEAMRRTFQFLHIRGTVVIGEGERDEAPMLYIGEELGDGDGDAPEVDIA